MSNFFPESKHSGGNVIEIYQKNKVDQLFLDKLVPASVDLHKLSEVVKTNFVKIFFKKCM